MFAKLFKKSRSFDPSELTHLPELDASAQLTLLDQYLLHRKDHAPATDEGTVVLALLAPYTHSTANVTGTELEVVKRTLSLISEADSIQTLLDHQSLGDLAAKRIVNCCRSIQRIRPMRTSVFFKQGCKRRLRPILRR